MNKKSKMTLYICDPDKNTECKKTVCATYNKKFAFCYMTTEEKFAKRDENGQPIKAEEVFEDAEQQAETDNNSETG